VAPRQENGNTKLSSDLISEEIGGQEKPSTWSEHVWSTFIHRGYSDDVTEKLPLVNGKVNLLHCIGEEDSITRFLVGFTDELPTGQVQILFLPRLGSQLRPRHIQGRLHQAEQEDQALHGLVHQHNPVSGSSGRNGKKFVHFF